MQSAMDTWRPSGRFFFRFAFLFLGATSILCWDALTFLLYRSFSTAPYDFGAFYGILRTPMHWLDAHIFHIGYNPATQMSFPGDNHFGVLFYLVLLPAALIDTDDSTRRYVFNYSNPAKTQLLLTGKWKNNDVKILMNDVPIDSMWLNRDQIKLIRD